MAIALSTRAQNVSYKIVVHEEKCAEGAKNFKHKSETIVSGVKNIAKRTKIQSKKQ